MVNLQTPPNESMDSTDEFSLSTSLNGFEDGRFVGDATVPLTKARSCADAERASALHEFMLNFGFRADNTWSEWDCVTRIGWRHESRESQVDYLFSSEETTLLELWVDSSLVCGSDHLAVVGAYQTVRNAGVSGAGKKKRIPCALLWTANDPVAWEKAVGGSGEFGADWRDPLAFLGFLARTADAHKTRRKCEEDQVICDLKAQLHCATTAAERRRCSRLLWRRRRALARQAISSATEAWQSLQLAESFWAGTSVVGHQNFLRRHF